LGGDFIQKFKVPKTYWNVEPRAVAVETSDYLNVTNGTYTVGENEDIITIHHNYQYSGLVTVDLFPECNGNYNFTIVVDECYQG